MTDLMPDVQPREPRYAACADLEASVFIQRARGSDPETISGQLIELSRGGAKLIVPEELSLSEVATVRLQIPELQIDLSVAIEVCWSEMTDDDAWLVGCSFAPELPPDVLSQMAAGGFVDRRNAPRFGVSLRATACWEQDEVRMPVRLQDISIGGFCMSCPKVNRAVDRLTVHLSRADGKMEVIPARMRWQLKASEHYLIGCSFINSFDFERVREVANLEAARLLADSQPKRRRSSWIMFGAVALASFVVSYLAIFLVNWLGPQEPVAAVVVKPQASSVLPAASSELKSEAMAAAKPAAAPVEPTTSAPAASSPATEKRSPAESTDHSPPTTDGANRPAPTPAPSAAAAVPVANISTSASTAQASNSSGASAANVIDDRGSRPIPESTPYDREPAARESANAPAKRVDPPTHRFVVSEALQVLGNPRESQSIGFDETTATTPMSSDLVEVITRTIFAPAPIEAPAAAIEDAPSQAVQSVPDAPPHQALADESPTTGVAAPAEPPPTVLNAEPVEAPASAPMPPVVGPGVPELGRVRASHVSDEPASRASLAAFQRGIDLYRTSQYARAAEAFAGAAQFDPSSALYLYFEALARRQAGQADAAQQCIERAAELEKSHPVAGRGQAMERYQGPARRWLERARADALKVR